VILTHRRTVAASPSRVVAVLHDVERWASWLPGLREAVVDPRTRHVRLRADGPREYAAILEITPLPDGLLVGLVQGDVSALQGQIRVASDADASVVVWEQELVLQTPMPGTLVSELDLQVLPGCLRAMEAEALRRT
jgi:hypothetical protein